MIKKRITGKFVILSEIEEKDFEKIILWRNDPEYNKYLNQPFQLTFKLQNEWYQKYKEDDTQITYGIRLKKNKKLIGTIGSTEIDFIKKKFIPGRLLIDKDYRIGPYIIDSFVSLYDYFFIKNDFKKAYLYPAKDNKPAISVNRQFGFKKNEIFCNKEYQVINGMEMIELECTRDNYLKSKQRNKLILSRFEKGMHYD